MLCSDDHERARKVARRLIESMLFDRKEIEKFDDTLAPEDPLHFDRQSAGLIRQMYERWADEAKSLLEQIAKGAQRFGPVPEIEKLQYAFGKTMAMLSISLDDMDAGCRDILEGRLHSAEEVRRELHLRTH